MMAVFLAASDETRESDDFVYGGWVGPLVDWEQHFAPAWSARVLDGPPKIPYLHMTELRSPRWRAEHALSLADAERRVTEAACVCRSMGSLLPVRVGLSKDVFLRATQRFGNRAVYGDLFQQIDGFAYAYFVMTVLAHIEAWASPNPVTRVDFAVERNGPVTETLRRVHQQIKNILCHSVYADKAGLLGDFLPDGKAAIPLQAADLVLWHHQRRLTGRAGASDIPNLRRLLSRPGVAPRWGEDNIIELVVALMIGPLPGEPGTEPLSDTP